MKRVIEERNLAFNHMTKICDICKRCEGFREDNDDIYKCKYNTDNKGLFSGLVINHMNNYKCKYFKRSQKYLTCKLQYKNSIRNNSKQIKYKRGKFTFTDIERNRINESI